MAILCTRCGKREAVFYQRHTGERLCRECFVEDLESRVLDQIRRYNMISPGDKILIGISGGKDSYTLLHLLAHIHPPSKLIGVMINEGIKEYNREDVFSYLSNVCRELGIDCIVTSIKKELGYSVDEFVMLQLKKFGRYEISACTYCGIARRRILNKYARMFGVNKVATGHNLDDEVQTYLINIMRGDVMRLIQLHPLSATHSPKLIKRIKPLRAIYEYETAFFAYINNFRFQETECPYITQLLTLRSKVRELIKEIEKRYPDIQLKFLQFIDMSVEPLVKTRNIESITLPLCSQCGEPTSPNRSLCKFCEIINSITK